MNLKSLAIAMQARATRKIETLTTPSFALVQSKAVCAPMILIDELGFASLAVPGAHQSTKKTVK
jgi:hypothetical protein